MVRVVFEKKSLGLKVKVMEMVFGLPCFPEAIFSGPTAISGRVTSMLVRLSPRICES